MTSVLGKDANGISITIDKAERRHGLYIQGSTGTGKSTLLLNLILDDITDGTGVCLLDPHADLTNRVIECMDVSRYEDVILLDLTGDYPFGLNLYDCADPTDYKQVQYTIERIMHIWDRLFNISRLTPQMVEYMRNCAYTIVCNPGYTMAEIPFLFSDKKFRYKLLANVKNIYVKQFWQDYENMPNLDRSRETSAIRNKLSEFLQDFTVPIVGQTKSTLDMRTIMDATPGKILLCKLDPNLESVTSLIGSTIIALIRNAAFSREDIPIRKRKPFNIYLEEGDRFATLDTKSLMDEGRKYGTTVTFTLQTRDKLHREVPQLVRSTLQGNIIAFRLTAPDSEEVAGVFDTTPPEPKMEESGRRKKQTPVVNVVEWLRSARGGHPNPIVNQFTAKYLLDKVYTTQEETLANAGADKRNRENFNTDLYYVMISKRVNHKYIQETCVLWICCTEHLDLLDGFYCTEENKDELDVILQEVQDTADAILMKMWHAKTDSDLYKEAEDLRQVMHGYLARCTHDWFEFLYEIEILPTLLVLARDENLTPHPNNESQFHKQRMEAAIPQLLLPRRDPNDYFTTEFHRLEKRYLELCEEVKPENVYSEMKHQKICEFVRLFRGTLEALAQTPILADSGEEEIIYRPGPQQTHADKQAEIANMLTSLQNMTAYVRVAGQEHTVTVKHTQPDGKRSSLGNVIKTITQWNLEDGYIRERAEVEKEIEARHRDDGDPPPPPGGSGGGATPKQPDNGSTPSVNRASTPLPTSRKRKIGS